MTVPTISNLPTVPATSDPNFETEAPALFNHIKNTFVSEMNSAISFINSSTFDATVEFKNADFTAARNFLYMIDTSSVGISVTLPANPSTGDQLLLMDQKRNFGTNNLTIVRNSQNINGAASNVVSKSTGALIRCIFQASYGWTVDLYEGQWESGTTAGDLVYNGGNVGIGTSAPGSIFDVQGVASSLNAPIGAFINKYDNATNGTSSYAVMRLGRVGSDGVSYGNSVDFGVSRYESSGTDSRTRLDISLSHTTASTDTNVMTLRSDGNVGIGTSEPKTELQIHNPANAASYSKFTNVNTGATATDGTTVGISTAGDFQIWNWENSEVQIATNNTQRLTIKNDGNVGIGTDEPSLEIFGGGQVIHLKSGISVLRLESDGADFEIGASNSQNNAFIWNKSNGGTIFGTNNSEKMRITSGGNVELKTGNLVIGTAGKGIDFSANSNATGMSSELFDSYEEGSFSPTLQGGDYGGTWTDNNSTGIYTKIGNIVTISLSLKTSTTINFSAQTKYIIFQGLPFSTASNGGTSGAVANGAIGTYGVGGTALLGDSSGHIYFYGFNSTASINNLRLTISYRVS